MKILATAAVIGAALSACQSAPARAAAPDTRRTPEIQPDLPVSMPPFDDVRVNWKQRLDQPYVYVERHGSYTQIGSALEEVWRALGDQHLEPSGPPFALYFDDPGRVAVADLRMRACFPVASPCSVGAPLVCDVLESTTVVYAFVGGAYPDVPRAYPGLYDFLAKLGWTENGPIREIYLVNPALVRDPNQLVAEVQIPATAGGGPR